MVSELVTNLVLHAKIGGMLRLSRAGDRLRIEVTDADPTLPLERCSTVDAEDGRGLAIIEALTTTYVWKPRHDGKLLICELS